jgi:DNA-binding NarL/FixJ family response regulator
MYPTQILRIALIDDDRLVLDSMNLVLGSLGSVASVRLFADAKKAVRALAIDPVDIALVDLSMPGLSGFDCLRRLAADGSATHRVAHTHADDRGSINRALAAGATGYLIKARSAEETAASLRSLVAGRPALSAPALQEVLGKFRKRPVAFTADGLTPTEFRVLAALANGGTLKTIAGELCITVGTLYVHNRNLRTKLGAKSRLEMVARYHDLVNKAKTQPDLGTPMLPQRRPRRSEQPQGRPSSRT